MSLVSRIRLCFLIRCGGGHIQHPPLVAAHYMRAAVRCQLVLFIQQLGFDTVHSPDTISDHALFDARML
jgi:hypothetical protein